MQLGMELSQNQTMRLALTPELRQSINILQFSSIELIDFLHQQAVENPVLEVKEKENPIPVFSSNHFIKSSFTISAANKDYDPFSHYSVMKITLENHLVEQVMTLKNITPTQNKILRFLIGNLNQQGYLEIEPAIAARIFSVTLEEMKTGIHILQSLDPIGVGARNFVDCLLIQMRDKAQKHPLAYQIIEKYLEDLAAKHYRKLAKIFGVSVTEIQEAADFIKTLNPHPCSEFHYEMTQYIVPDVIVENIKNKHIVIVNDQIIPDLTINHFYKDNLKNKDVDGTENYLKTKYHDAAILMNGIAQRKLTLYNVTRAIVARQKEFLKHGMSGLKPMTLKDISEELGVHESTVSRATSNKYIQTPHGLFKLKSLFTTGVNRANQTETDSSAAVKEKIKALINKENNQKPFSDQKLVQLLEKDEILISRRTVAKYREEIGIPGSSKRRRF